MSLDDPKKKNVSRRDFLSGVIAGTVGVFGGNAISEGMDSYEAIKKGQALEPSFVKNLAYVGFSQDEISKLEDSIKQTVAQRIKEKLGEECEA